MAEDVHAASPAVDVDAGDSSRPLTEKANDSPPPSPVVKRSASFEQRREKRSQILDACCEEKLDDLIHLATTRYGLVDDETRRIAWPILLGSAASRARNADNWKSMAKHIDENQVKLDVDRSFVYYPHGESNKQLDKRKHDLQELIVSTLRQFPFLCYFQGYHDIVQVILLVLGRDLAGPAVARLSLLRIRDFMLPSMAATTTHLQLLPAILQCADRQVAQHLSHTQPFFALAATLTLYAHDIQEYGEIARLFDFLLAHEAIMSIYLFAVIIVSRKDELLEIEQDEPEMLHSILCKLPKPLDLEGLIKKTVDLFDAYPPEKLPLTVWWRVPSSSVLVTTRDPTQLAVQSLDDGERYFQKQATQLQRMQTLQNTQKVLWKYRGHIGTAGAVAIALVASYYLRRNGHGSGMSLPIWHRMQSWIGLFP